MSARRNRQDDKKALPWKWGGTFIAALIGAAVILAVKGQSVSVAFLIGRSVPLFALAMLVAVFIRGWAGLVAGIVVVSLLTIISLFA